jgi:uncharacterized protein (TIGR01319 family)
MDKEKIKTVLVTDCGSTTTKALLFERTKEGWRQTFRGEAPTTVEEPVADVTVGALNAFKEIEELSSRQLVQDEAEGSPFIYSEGNPAKGIDLYLSTSSAGGGLQMMVAGVVKEMTTESAQRAALGAGAIVMDAISADDGREEHQRVSQVRHIKPDIVLLTGGVDGGSKTHVMEVAEMLLAASPRPRFGDTLKLPVIYAGNKEAANDVKNLLEAKCQVSIVPNVRPTLDEENLHPAREAIHEFFLEHVMSHSPGYGKLLSWSPVPVMPTPAAVGLMIEDYASVSGKQVLCADIGGATTDVFSVFKDAEGKPVFNRTVSANLGMSYSIANVLIESGSNNIARWLPYKISESDLRDRLRNKMIRPTTIPQTLEDLWLEQAVCREALSLSLVHHRSLAVGLSGVQKSRSVSDIFSQKKNRYELVDMMKLDIVIGSGGVLSHAPSRLSSALMMLDGFGLQGLTQITVDSIFMLPHLGVLSTVNSQAASEIFNKDCIVNIAHAIVPLYKGKVEKGAELAKVFLDGSLKDTIYKDDLRQININDKKKTLLKLQPAGRSIDIGAGAGKTLEKEIECGLHGLIIDGRNRPLTFSEDEGERIAAQAGIYKSLGLIK